ncbi:MAG: hypothetical protein ACK5MZ_00685, partial [Aestuariibaculum sp.]
MKIFRLSLGNLYWFILFIGLLGFNKIFAQTTPIPDANFEAFLIVQGIDTNGANGNILNTEAEAVTALSVTVNNITDFSGLEAFVNLTSLNAGTNQFASLPLNTLTALEELEFRNNDALASLDLSNNVALRILDIGSLFSSLAPHPPITSLDLSNNTSLESLDIFYFINMVSLDLPATNTLTSVDIYNLADPTLDFTELSGLESLRIRFSSAPSTTISLPNVKTVLEDLDIQGFDIPTIDVSDYTSLVRVEFNSTDVETLLLPSTSTLITVDVQHHNLQHTLNFSIVPNLTNLRINYNDTTPLVIDITQNLLLEDLDLYGNDMTNIDLTKNTALTILRLDNNAFASLDITNNTLLEDVSAIRNQLTTLDLSKNTVLEQLNISTNQFAALDVTNNPALEFLTISDNLFTGTGLDLTQNLKLYYINCSTNQIESLNISQNTKLDSFIGHHNLFSGTNIMDQFYSIKASGSGINASDTFDVSFNRLSGTIPNFAGLLTSNTNYFRFRFNDNRFHFGDFENDHGDYIWAMNNTNTSGSSERPIMTEYHYAPQDKVNAIETHTPNVGTNLTLTTTVRGAQNHYQWFKDGLAVPGAPDSPNYTLYNVTDCDNGVYYAMVTSDLVPFENGNPPGTSGKNLQLVRNDITVTVQGVSKTCPALADPIADATDVPVNTGLEWAESAGACGYKLSVGTNAAANNLVNNVDVGQTTVYNFASDLTANTTYNVRIVPYFDDGDLAGCTVQSFTTVTNRVVPDCSALLAPYPGETDVYVGTSLEWTIASGAEGYRLFVGTTSGAGDIVNEDITGGNTNTYSFVSDLPANTEIFVTIVPYNTEGNATGCSGHSFTTLGTTVTPTVPNCT